MMICPRCLRQFEEEYANCPDDGARLRQFRDQTSQLVGRVLDGRWEIIDKIGEGGMGEVYRARQLNVDRIVAVKVLRIALASTEQYVSRFFREADIAASVQHPHFASVYDFGQSSEDQLLYIAMELLQGETLSALSRRRRLALAEVLQIASQVCAAMAAAHDARIVHRDLKPDNIFLVEVPEGGLFVKVLDFGIAKDLDADQFTRTGQLFGTPEYMSPEQCEGKARVDGRSDLYALGCVLYELITARPPFQRESIIQTLLAQIGDEPRSFDDIGLPVPPVVENVVYTLLEKHPDDRYGNAIDAREAIEEARAWLEANPAEAKAYETVSTQIRPRKDAARTVSYSELGHPLRLEGILGRSDRDALLKQRDRRREQDAERETVERDDALGPGKVFLFAGVALLAVFGVAGFSLFEREPREATAVTEAPPAPATQTAASQPDPAALAATEDARRTATSSLLTISAFAATRAAAATVAKAPPRPVREVATPDALLDVRTQTSIRQRFLRSQKKLLGCYDRREDPLDGGTVEFELHIGPTGTVSSARAASNSMRSAAALRCMEEILEKIAFAPAAGTSIYRKQLTFQSSE